MTAAIFFAKTKMGSTERVVNKHAKKGRQTALQRAADTDADLGMAAPDLVENGHRPQARGALQQRHYLAVPNLSQRISTSAATRRFLLRRQPWILFETIAGGGAEPGFGRGNARRLGSAETHI